MDNPGEPTTPFHNRAPKPAPDFKESARAINRALNALKLYDQIVSSIVKNKVARVFCSQILP